MSDAFAFSSDYATLVVFDPELLSHRVRDKEGWWRRDDLTQVEEVEGGLVALLPIGREGRYRAILRIGEPTDAEAAIAVGVVSGLGLRVTSGEVFVGAAERLPGDGRGERLSFIPDTGGLVEVPPGDYALRVHVLDWRSDDAHYDEDGEVRGSAPADFLALLSPREGAFVPPSDLTPLLKLLPKHEAKGKAKVSRAPVKRRGSSSSERTRRRSPRSSPSESAGPTVPVPPPSVPEEVAPYSEERVRAAFRDVLYANTLRPPPAPRSEMLLMRPRDRGLLAHDIATSALRTKITRVREHMRVFESKVNGHKGLTYLDKAELEVPITRLYESLGGLVEFLDGLIPAN